MRIVLSEEEKTPLEDVLVAGFEAFNGPHVGPHGWAPLRLMVFRDGEEATCGGLQGHCYGAWLHVLMFHLPADLDADDFQAALQPHAQRSQQRQEFTGCRGRHDGRIKSRCRSHHQRFGQHGEGQARHPVLPLDCW